MAQVQAVKINLGRVVLGGIVVGIAIDIFEGV
jgi:hypothetical protein